ncbi:MAG: SLC13 family permease, partial [Nitriliruptoraceae bacterium]
LWWITEALPLPVTSLVPIVALPLTGALELSATTQAYGNPLIFLFLGGFLLGLAMQRWGLHRRLALVTVRLVGTRPRRLIGGFMVAAAGLSMWVSNTATVVMMLPIGVSVLGLVAAKLDADPSTEPSKPDPDADGTSPVGADARAAAPDSAADIATGPAPNLGTGLMLGIAYAASIGSLATLIGTPPNTFLAGFLEQTYGIDLGFAQWMLLALPLSVVFLALAWLVLTRLLFPPEVDEIPGGRDLIDSELAALGPLGRGERNVLVVFVLMAGAWTLRGPLQSALAGTTLEAIDDPIIAVAGGVLLFVLPVDVRAGVFTMDWATARQLPWDVLLLFGGGLALAAAVTANEVDVFIGSRLARLSEVPLPVLLLVIVATVIALTELTSNTATTAALVPVVAGSAVVLGLDPMVLAVPTALAATCAFALPVATPPNAIVFGSGYVTIGQMIRTGLVLNVLGVVLIAAVAVWWMPLVLTG